MLYSSRPEADIMNPCIIYCSMCKILGLSKSFVGETRGDILIQDEFEKYVFGYVLKNRFQISEISILF